jgi:ribosomal protein S17
MSQQIAQASARDDQTCAEARRADVVSIVECSPTIANGRASTFLAAHRTK